MKINETDKFSENSELIEIFPNKKYRTSSVIKGVKGQIFCGYFGAIILNSDQIEIDRKIRWINDFSSLSLEYLLIFLAPRDAKYVRLCYRINEEVPYRSCFECELKPLKQINLEVSDENTEVFETTESFFSAEVGKKLNQSKFQLNLSKTSKNLISRGLSQFSIKLSKPKELDEKQELSLEKNMVWIFAFPRSGTQWLGTQLLSYDTNILTGPSIGIHLGSVQGGMENKFLRNIEFLHKEPKLI